MTALSIVVLTSGDKHQRDITAIDFDPKDRAGKTLGEIPHKVMFLRPKYVTDGVNLQKRF